MNKFEKIEKRMNEWQSGIRILYKDVQTNHNWTDDHVWKELENEIKRICPEGQFGEDDLAWTREILTSKRDITCLLYTSPSPRDATLSRMPSSA